MANLDEQVPVLPLTLQNQTEGEVEVSEHPNLPAGVTGVEDIANTAIESYVEAKKHGKPTFKPTRKWITAAALGVLTIAGHVIATGSFDAAEWAEVLTLGTALAGGYFATNEATPGGVPTKTEDIS